jgi:hypothetical protein
LWDFIFLLKRDVEKLGKGLAIAINIISVGDSENVGIYVLE